MKLPHCEVPTAMLEDRERIGEAKVTEVGSVTLSIASASDELHGATPCAFVCESLGTRVVRVSVLERESKPLGGGEALGWCADGIW